MAYCTNCGKEFKSGEHFCTACGAKMAETAEKTYEKDVAENKVFAIFAYIGILVLIPILAAPKDSKFARFHANQGLVLLISEVILSAVGAFLELLGGVLWILGVVLIPAGVVLQAIPVIWMIIGIVNAARGETKELPIIGQYTILK